MSALKLIGMTVIPMLCLPLASGAQSTHISYTINNLTNETYTTVKIADPTERETTYHIESGINTVMLKEDYNVIIQLKNNTNDSISIIIQPGKLPTCYPRPQRCQFDPNQPNYVTLVR